MQRRRAVSRKQNRRVHALITLIFCIAVFILVCVGCFLLVKTDGTITNKPNQSQEIPAPPRPTVQTAPRMATASRNSPP